MSLPILALTSIIFARAACELVKMIIFNRLPFFVFLILIFKAFEIAHSFASNESLFFPNIANIGVFLVTYLVFYQIKQ